MPETFVVQVWPALTGMASVNVPVVMISPAASGGLCGSLRQQFDQMAQRQKGAVEHERAAAALAQLLVAIKLGFECREFAQPLALRGAIACRSPTSNAPCTPLAATVSAAANFQPG